jgi:hypothetical protein
LTELLAGLEGSEVVAREAVFRRKAVTRTCVSIPPVARRSIQPLALPLFIFVFGMMILFLASGERYAPRSLARGICRQIRVDGGIVSSSGADWHIGVFPRDPALIDRRATGRVYKSTLQRDSSPVWRSGIRRTTRRGDGVESTLIGDVRRGVCVWAAGDDAAAFCIVCIGIGSDGLSDETRGDPWFWRNRLLRDPYGERRVAGGI